MTLIFRGVDLLFIMFYELDLILLVLHGADLSYVT